MRPTNYLRILALVAMLAISIGPAPAAFAADPTTSATVAGGSSGSGAVAANIECKWELPDMDSTSSSPGFPDPFIQYSKGTNNAKSDDSANAPTTSDGTTSATPCTLPAGSAEPLTGNPGVITNGVAGPPPTTSLNTLTAYRKSITVKPNAHDAPEMRRVQLWGAVDPPSDGSGIADINWDVYHPDGSLKTEQHALPYNGSLVRTGAGQVDYTVCQQSLLNPSSANLGNSATVGVPTDMFAAAVITGQIGATAVDDPGKGMLYLCGQKAKNLYYAWFQISKHQPCGEYKIILNARTGNGALSSLTNTIDVTCFNSIVLDFTSVNYGTITPGNGKVVQGDVDMTTPNAPTVQNQGNSGMGVSVNFTPMTNGIDSITSFDACFAGSNTKADGTGVAAKAAFCKDPITAGTATPVWDITSPATKGNGTLCANRVGKLDFSIHPQSGISTGVYTGSVAVVAVPSKLCLTDFGHPDTTIVMGADNQFYPTGPVGDGLNSANEGHVAVLP